MNTLLLTFDSISADMQRLAERIPTAFDGEELDDYSRDLMELRSRVDSLKESYQADLADAEGKV